MGREGLTSDQTCLILWVNYKPFNSQCVTQGIFKRFPTKVVFVESNLLKIWIYLPFIFWLVFSFGDIIKRIISVT